MSHARVVAGPCNAVFSALYPNGAIQQGSQEDLPAGAEGERKHRVGGIRQGSGEFLRVTLKRLTQKICKATP